MEKQPGPVSGESVPLAERRQHAVQGDVYHLSDGVRPWWSATGMDTELGRIAAMLQAEEDGKTPLQKRLALFGKKLAYAVIVICAIVFVAGLLREEQPVRIFLVAVSLAVAAIPEALPAVVTISLATGRPQDGQAERPRPKTARRGDPGFGHLHLHGQDRNPYR